jgi:hypothetical protein
MSRKPTYAEYDPWATYDPREEYVRVNPKRERKPTLASAMKEAEKAGVSVAGAVVKPDGSIELRFGDSQDKAAQPNGHDIESADELRRLI